MTQKPTIAAVGEILWDVFPDGPRFGGAPANFACHAAAVGAEVLMVSGVGSDELGDAAIEHLKGRGVDTSFVTRSESHPTGQVQVTVDDQGHAKYEFGTDEAWDHLTWTKEHAELAGRIDAVCFGTLGGRHADSREAIQQFVSATPNSAWRVFDINLRPPHYDDAVIEQSLSLANVLKLNDDELDVLAKQFHLTGSETVLMRQLVERFELRLVALTRSAEGALLVTEKETFESAGESVSVRDTVGAGDAFTAALVVGLLQQAPLEAIVQHACQVAAFVCSEPGATPKLPDQIRNTFD